MNDKFITNYTENTFLDNLRNSIEKCTSFCFSVSFIKKAGLVLIERVLEEALKRGVKGKIITSTYQNFTDIPSLRTFLSWMENYPNFECHLDFNSFGDNGFHSKGYLFEYSDSIEFIVGSSNITRFALLKNIEWNVSIKAEESFDSANSAKKEFEDLWNKTLKLDHNLIAKYQLQLDYAIEKWDMDYYDPISLKIKPNSMQRRALKELQRYRSMGVNKALIVSATGSGKTYLAAFDARNMDAKRVLFVVHRDKILNDALDTFKRVFGVSRTYGLYVGKNKELDCDFVFASNIMLSMHLDQFDKNEFDYIVMDECHHAVADTYQKIMNHFTPEFMLGLTATPERMDNVDVFELFDKNVPFELRLRDAIINDLVVPFHYYGIRDQLADYSYVDAAQISKEIAKPENVAFIVGEIRKHHQNGKLKAIAFCSSISHASLMADELADFGFSTVALTGKNDYGQRVKAFNDLQDDNNPLEIICAVDILNEGVDIPQVNMVLFLRPTDSSTIFIQQLGRGLRKYEGKQYLTVLDFIGNNYKRSIQIALALGSLSKSTIIEKQYLIDLIQNDFHALNIPGVVINIDSLSKEEVIDNIRNENFNKMTYLQKDYENFKKYLNKETYPTHMDYLNNDCAPDLLRFSKTSMLNAKGSYYNFLNKIGEATLPVFSAEQISFINTISNLLPIARVDEYIIIKQLLEKGYLNFEELINYNDKVTIDSLNHGLKRWIDSKIIKDNKLNIELSEKLLDFVQDIIEYGLTRYDIEFGEFDGIYKLYGNYYSDQIQSVRRRSFSPYMRGTEFDLTNKETYCYVTLNKDIDKDARLNYKDKFLSPKIFQWESVKNTTLTTGDGPKLLNTEVIHLFVRKVKNEDNIAMPFTYFGTGKFINQRSSSTKEIVENVEKEFPTLMFDIKLDNRVPEEYWFDFEILEEE